MKTQPEKTHLGRISATVHVSALLQAKIYFLHLIILGNDNGRLIKGKPYSNVPEKSTDNRFSTTQFGCPYIDHPN